MRNILLVGLLRGSVALSIEKRSHSDLEARSLDAIAGGYDKHPIESYDTTNGTSPAPRAFASVFETRDQCNNGVVDCLDYQCDECGSCCGGGKCAKNFGNCCSVDTQCSFGFSCCTTFSGCCYEDTSFCCDYSPTGCCVKGTQCTTDGCVGVPAFLLESITTTTTLTSVVYYTSTVVETSLSTNFGVTTEFVTSTITNDNVDVATVTNYVTSTKIAKRFLPGNVQKTQRPIEKRNRPTPLAPSPTAVGNMNALRNSLGDIGLLPKRAVTSYIYDFVFVWDTYSSDVFETSTMVSEVDSMSTQFSTITSTLFNNAKQTTTVVSTVVVTSTQVDTSTPDPTTGASPTAPTQPAATTTSNNIVVATTFAVGVTNSGSDPATLGTTIINGGGASGGQVATGAPTIVPGSAGSSSGPETTAPTSSSVSPGSTSNIHSDLSTGAKAGIGAGAGAAGLALLGAIVFFALGRQRRPTSTISTGNSQAQMAPSTAANWTPPPPPHRHSHLDSREVSYTERAAALARSMEARSQTRSTPSFQDQQQSSNFSPISRGASLSTPSEMMGYESPRADMHEMGGTTENMGWNAGPSTEHYEMPAQPYHELPSPPEPTHSQNHGQGYGW
ncbi:hypothetical protein F5Y19DRAFT_489644 [Xylariaceae sp. FL1651]|nr:hypothetical protein F5Y19DRAFT_489644 [Xylariaceae sp. FL1651]